MDPPSPRRAAGARADSRFACSTPGNSARVSCSAGCSAPPPGAATRTPHPTPSASPGT